MSRREENPNGDYDAAASGGGNVGVAAGSNSANVSETASLRREVSALSTMIKGTRGYDSADDPLLPKSGDEMEAAEDTARKRKRIQQKQT